MKIYLIYSRYKAQNADTWYRPPGEWFSLCEPYFDNKVEAEQMLAAFREHHWDMEHGIEELDMPDDYTPIPLRAPDETETNS